MRFFAYAMFCLFVIGIFSCSNPEYNVEKIITADGPEDMALDLSIDGQPRIIISCSTRKGEDRYGKIQYYDLNDESISDFKITGYNTSPMRPHGINVVTIDSINYLYVISHEWNAEEEMVDYIVKFQISNDSLFFQQKWSSKEIDFMDATNDLHVTESGSIYCTNPTHVGFKEVPAVVGLIRPDGTHEVIADGLAYPNGIFVNGKDLYVATAQGNILYKYQLNDQGTVVKGSKTEAAEITGGDNITMSGDDLIIANHPSLVRFVLHSRYGWKSPSSVYKYNTKSGESKQIFGPSAEYINASSTGLIYEDHLYISQVFEGFILKVPLSELDK